ncbi:hypothetical protein UFOVP257_394 [uncultured Caudovirales phage]|uniref:Uncharacterized protein n=1 Tax=uncultured Caudovirales phage TaxID=2100421 RepID=A0A6J5LJA8_9CAUD|nr:hypothetical protein UFOVP257_394 [uncultured Caudovirales phage]
MEQETQTPNADVPSLSLQDLVLLMNLVRVTAERGAIKAEEMTAVGAVHDKLLKFLQASGAVATKPAEAEQPPAAE